MKIKPEHYTIGLGVLLAIVVMTAFFTGEFTANEAIERLVSFASGGAIFGGMAYGGGKRKGAR